MSTEPALNTIGSISHFFTAHRPLSLLLLIVIVLFGAFAFFATPKQYNPEIVRPAFLVSLQYQGATSEAAIDRVVYELVEKIDAVPGVDDIYTEVADGAEVSTTVIFEVGYDATKAKVDLLSQIEQHSYLAKGFIAAPTVFEINPETIPILQIAFSGSDMSLEELRERVLSLSHELGAIEAVSEVSLYGGYEPALIVAVDPAKMAAQGISQEMLRSVLVQSQLRVRYEGVDTGSHHIGIAFDGRAQSAEEVGALMIAPNVLVRDVASVYMGPQNRSYVLHTTDTTTGEVVMLSVAKREGASAPVVSEAVLGTLEMVLGKDVYSGVSYAVVNDDGDTAATEIFGLTKNLLTSIAIVAMVLFLFLSARAASVVLIAIPLTLLIVFGLGLLFDQTINRITLFALILSLGLLVDSAIVVVENIFSHLREWRFSGAGAQREHVIARAVHEIGVGLLLSTVTSVIVFLPMRYITGMMGPYMGPIAFFVPAALITSLFVAIVITPFLASWILDPYEKHNRFSKWFERIMGFVADRYQIFLRTVLAHRGYQRRILRGALMLFLVSLLLPLFGLVHFQMLPKADLNQFYVYIDLPVGTSIERTAAVSASVSEALQAEEQVTHIQQFVGTPPIVDFNGMFKGAQLRSHPYQATLRVNLTPKEARGESSTDIVHAARTHVNQVVREAAYVRFMEEPPGPPVRATLVAKLFSQEQQSLAQHTRTLLPDITAVAGVVDVDVSIDEPSGEVVYYFDTAKANQLGVSASAVQEVLALVDGVDVVEFAGSSHVAYTPLRVQLPHAAAFAPGALLQLPVDTFSGETIPLGTVVQVAEELRPAQLQFEDVQPVAYITAEVEGRSIVYVVIDLMKRFIGGDVVGYRVVDWDLFSLALVGPSGEQLTLVWGGEWEMTLENFRDLGIAMGVALLLVYAVLVAQYNQFAKPAYILVTVPLGLIGILWGFFFLDQGFSIYLTATALIGFIALIGLVVNNAIIFLEYVEQAQARGATFADALVAAGAARLRPIFLTSLTTVLGSLTIASDPVWSGLAWAIVFGLSLSTVLTLVMYPILLMYFNGAPEESLTDT